MAKSTYDHQVSFHVTKAMHAHFTRLADTRNVPIAEIGREAVRIYLSEQEDLQAVANISVKGYQPAGLSGMAADGSAVCRLQRTERAHLERFRSETDAEYFAGQRLKLMYEQQEWLHHSTPSTF